MKKIALTILVSGLLLTSMATSGPRNAVAVIDENYDSFYDCEFVMEKGVRFTAEQELSFHGYMLRREYEQIKQKYQNISLGTLVFPTYYVAEYGEVTVESVFGSNPTYVINQTETGKVTIYSVDSLTKLTAHNVEVNGKFDVRLYGAVDLEYTGISFIKANLFGVNVHRLAQANHNSTSLINLAEETVDNEFLTAEVREAAGALITSYATTAENVKYYIETYLDEVLVSRETKMATYNAKIEITVPDKPGYVFMKLKSNTEGYARANDEAVFRLYFISNPTYTISYYAMDADANYQLIKQITGLTADFYDVITLSEEEKNLPSDANLPVDGYKDDYEYAASDSMVTGVNDGELELRVCYRVSSRICSFMRRTNGVYQLTKQLDNSVPYGYLMCGTFATTAVFSVRVPKEIITLGGSQPCGGITFTNGTTLPEGHTVGLRKPGDWVAMDIGLHVKGLKTSNNIDQHAYARAAEISDAPQCEALYYDKVAKDDNPTLINDQDRDLTVVLANDCFYVYIDEVLVTVFYTDTTFFMPKDPATLQPRFHEGDSYMFGVYMGSWAAASTQIIGLKELYDEAAIAEIQSNPLFEDIVL
ncbi:MAG: hypothetical protein ACOX3K_02175 [Bacilli bacterium]|jgi:hypothetical protein